MRSAPPHCQRPRAEGQLAGTDCLNARATCKRVSFLTGSEFGWIRLCLEMGGKSTGGGGLTCEG